MFSPYTPSHPGLIICLIPYPATSSFQMSRSNEHFSLHSLRRGSHLAALFSVPIVGGSSLSLVDVTRWTDTRSRSPLSTSETETLSAHLLAFLAPSLAHPEKKENGKKIASEVELKFECILNAN